MLGLIIALMTILFLFLLCLIYLIFVPLIALYKVAANRFDLRSSEKGLWLVLIFILGPLAACIFFAKYSASRFVRVFNIGVMVTTIFCTAGIFSLVPWANRITVISLMSQRSNPLIQKLDPINRGKMEMSIDALVKEGTQLKWYEIQKIGTLNKLNDLLKLELTGNELSLPKIDEWVSTVSSRGFLDIQELDSFVKSKKLEAINSAYNGKYTLKYVTCQDPSLLTDAGRLLNQSIGNGQYSQILQIASNQLTISNIYTDAKSGKCQINEKRNLRISASQLDAESTQDVQIKIDGDFSPSLCQSKQAGNKPWMRIAQKQLSTIYFQETIGQNLCGTQSVFWTYSQETIPEPVTEATNQPPTVPQKWDSVACLSEFRQSHYTEAIRMAQDGLKKNPNSKFAATIVTASQDMLAHPNDLQKKRDWTFKIANASMDDLQALSESLKGAGK